MHREARLNFSIVPGKKLESIFLEFFLEFGSNFTPSLGLRCLLARNVEQPNLAIKNNLLYNFEKFPDLLNIYFKAVVI